MLVYAKRAAYFCRSIAIEMGGVSRYFPEVSGSAWGRLDSPEAIRNRNGENRAISAHSVPETWIPCIPSHSLRSKRRPKGPRAPKTLNRFRALGVK